MVHVYLISKLMYYEERTGKTPMRLEIHSNLIGVHALNTSVFKNATFLI